MLEYSAVSDDRLKNEDLVNNLTKRLQQSEQEKELVQRKFMKKVIAPSFSPLSFVMHAIMLAMTCLCVQCVRYVVRLSHCLLQSADDYHI